MSICPDLPLYGYTEYSGKIDYETWIQCGSKIVKYYQQKSRNKVFLFGLSAGGMLAYQIANECGQISGILVSCILDQRDIEVTKQTATSPLIATIGKPLMGISQKFIGGLKVPMKMIGNMKAIANNERLATLLMSDKKSSGVSVPIRLVYSMLTPVIKVEPEQFYACPFLLVHPGDDRWTDISGHFPIEELGLRQMEDACVRFLNRYA